MTKALLSSTTSYDSARLLIERAILLAGLDAKAVEIDGPGYRSLDGLDGALLQAADLVLDEQATYSAPDEVRDFLDVTVADYDRDEFDAVVRAMIRLRDRGITGRVPAGDYEADDYSLVLDLTEGEGYLACREPGVEIGSDDDAVASVVVGGKGGYGVELTPDAARELRVDPDFAVEVSFRSHGYSVTWTDVDGESRERAYEPGEPEAGALAVEWARKDVGHAVAEALREHLEFLEDAA